ncbi:retrovirus-related pol polyprotein from transposon TNT 1-94 [Tanacetum coccineum]
MLLMQAQENGAVLDEEELLFLAGEQGNTFDADVDNQPVQDLALNEDNIFQADKCDTFDSDVDEELTAQTIFMANLSSTGSANPQAGPSNASILSEVHTLENAIDHSVTNQDEHEIHNEVQQSNVIDSTSVYMGNNNVIPYEQYLSVNNISVVPSCASSTLNNIYKEQVAIYEQRAKFELTEREQRMDDQMRMLIQNHNLKTKEILKRTSFCQLQLNSTMENNKIIEGTVTTLKQELKQKESKFLTDFSNLKHLNDKLENKLHSQDQSIQTVHMMLNPTQPHHVLVIVSSSEEELELVEATRNKLHVKMNDHACVEKWSLNLAKRKAKELKANAPPLLVLPPATVYSPNTPVHLVPRTLPTTSQVNIGLYVITQLFWDFEKTCKKRITPTGITEGEMGFEQTKRCYLTEVIPFFNLLKEHFERIQKYLVNEVRAMKAVFENLEAEVDQNEIDLKSGEIERKNLLITNENLITECLSKDVFYTAIDYVLNVSRFSDMHDAFTIAQKRIANLESENFNLRNKIQNDDHDSMIKHFSKLEIQSRGNTIHELKEKISRLTKKNSDADPIFDLKALVSQNKDLTAKLNALHDLNERFRAENAKAQLKDNSKCVTIPNSKPKVLTPSRYPIDVEPIPPRLKKNREVHLHYIKHLKENVETLREIVEDAKVLPTKQWKPIGRLLPLGRQCPLVRSTALKSDCCTDHSLVFGLRLLKTYDWRSLTTLEFREKVYRDYSIRKRPFWYNYGLWGLYLEVAFRKHTCFVQDLDGVDLIKGSRGTNLYTIFIEDMMRSSPICLMSKASKNKSRLWHRRLNHLNFGTHNDLARKDLVRGLPRLKFEKDHLCSACQLRKSRKATHKPKMINTITEVLHTLYMDLCGPLGVQSINGKKYILVIVDDYSKFTWVKFLRSKDETPAFVINLLKQLQVGLNKTVRFVRTDNGTEFVNKDLTDYYESVGITYEKTVLRTP